MTKKVKVPEPVEEEVAEPAVEEEEVVREETPVEETEETTEEEPVVEEAEIPIVEPLKKKTAQERIDEITRARREAEREREYWRKIALEKEHKEPAKPEAPILPPRPTLDQFETTVAYEDALFEWRDRVTAIKSAETRARTEQETALRTFNERAKTLREEIEDFDEVIEAPVFSPTMRAVLLQSENGPEVAYYLGRPENRDQAERIRSFPADRQAYEIGKLETNLLIAKKTKKVPGAPAPLKPLGMGGVGEVDPSKMTTAEWMAWNKKRELQKLKDKYGG